MKTFRRIALIHLYPIIDFSFTANGQVYRLQKRFSSKRSDRYTLELKNKESKTIQKRHFTFQELRNTFVFLRDDVKTSKQPKNNIVITVNCL
jgi:hypothetical protein